MSTMLFVNDFMYNGLNADIDNPFSVVAISQSEGWIPCHALRVVQLNYLYIIIGL